ncbi:cytochrome ubiquinol oxidase subunit I [Nitratiruptor sp. YY09-18]|uniref:cytochrome ubiquinol oxidase subunit I n=1 Tax=Nitratiruptor sp. YY09-18 TaxID=2724901 RepID=UPI00191515E9|nr:cytochrome ubiquinol oxidase subunit I [Nitratiruptor sp. YY09-18]BCD67282.1 cytochrome bd ubiquinol oxidase subunit I [Nitratiruptor sp. YY09-18]
MTVDTSLVDWSRAQFALTAIYHFLFVPLTLGLSFIVAIMETIYVTTGDEKWKEVTLFWMKLFGINFAIGLATGIIMEFEFGTNWANYSWFVGDIFGAPLAIEGIMAFFLESTFFAVMFFGWNRVSKKFHLLATWLVAIGSNLSALWILVANGWMQHPVGMQFNPETARSEMVNFWDVIFNPNAFNKFLHTISAGYITAAIFVVAISAWFLLKNEKMRDFARRSILVAASFGLITSSYNILTGDNSAFTVVHNQPVKLAAMEGLYNGKQGADIVAFGILNPRKRVGDKEEDFIFAISIPKALSILGYHKLDAYIPGLNDLVFGNENRGIESAASKIAKGKKALAALKAYKEAKKSGNEQKAKAALAEFRQYEKYMGYGFLDKPEEIVPNVPIVFYSFHLMVGLGIWFFILMAVMLYKTMTGSLAQSRAWLKLAFYSLPLGFLANELGWIVAEVGRQPWAVQDLLPVKMATTHISTISVMITFWMFAFIFTLLLIAEVRIMATQVKLKAGGGKNV